MNMADPTTATLAKRKSTKGQTKRRVALTTWISTGYVQTTVVRSLPDVGVCLRMSRVSGLERRRQSLVVSCNTIYLIACVACYFIVFASCMYVFAYYKKTSALYIFKARTAEKEGGAEIQ